jgi:ribosome modulation factor
MNPNNQWLLTLIARGLQKLTTLSLDRTPSMETIDATAYTWLEAITADREWDETRDTPRFRAAFATLERDRTSWPAPRHLLDAVPRVAFDKSAALPARITHTDEHRARTLEWLREKGQEFRAPVPHDGQRKPEETLTEQQIHDREFAAGRLAATQGRSHDACPHRATDPASGRMTSAWLDGYWSVRESAA